jgi:aryl-alcohol dehydrogenase-like predicted oxidoreductase
MGGFLTGKYSKDKTPPAGSRFEYNPGFWERASSKANFAVLEQIRKVADDAGIPMSKLAVAWILKNQTVTAPIVGASNVEQVEENCRIAETSLSEETYQTLNELTKGSSFSLYS